MAPAEVLWEALRDFNERQPEEDSSPSLEEAVDLREYKTVFEYLNSLFGLDFTHYRFSSVGRRIQRRMDLLGIPEIKQYVEYMISNREESASLYHDLLIGVTSFFRDPDSFAALGRDFIAPRLREKGFTGFPDLGSRLRDR